MEVDLRSYVIFATVLTTIFAKGPSHGWNDNINWLTFEEALVMSHETNLPIMLLIHKTWCGACKALKPKFTESKDIENMSKHFLMVNLQDDEEPEDRKYSPDGGYIPRILFMQQGRILTDLYNKGGNEKYKYYYHNADSIVGTMARAVDDLGLKDLTSSDREDL